MSATLPTFTADIVVPDAIFVPLTLSPIYIFFVNYDVSITNAVPELIAPSLVSVILSPLDGAIALTVSVTAWGCVIVLFNNKEFELLDPDHIPNGKNIIVTNGAQGASGTNANLPPYWALIYIIKT